MKAKPVRLTTHDGYEQCSVDEATHVTLNIPGPTGLLTLPVIRSGTRAGTNCWTWNGSTDAPTLRPSVLSRGHDWRCHSWINDGAAHFLNDCSHELKGQTVSLLDVDPVPCAECVTPSVCGHETQCLEKYLKHRIGVIEEATKQEKEDAARYRWLRATTNWVSSKGERINVRDNPELWDSSIDAAIAKSKGAAIAAADGRKRPNAGGEAGSPALQSAKFVEKLRDAAAQAGHYGAWSGGVLLDQAADEIERLYAAREVKT